MNPQQAMHQRMMMGPQGEQWVPRPMIPQMPQRMNTPSTNVSQPQPQWIGRTMPNSMYGGEYFQPQTKLPVASNTPNPLLIQPMNATPQMPPTVLSLGSLTMNGGTTGPNFDMTTDFPSLPSALSTSRGSQPQSNLNSGSTIPNPLANSTSQTLNMSIQKPGPGLMGPSSVTIHPPQSQSQHKMMSSLKATPNLDPNDSSEYPGLPSHYKMKMSHGNLPFANESLSSSSPSSSSSMNNSLQQQLNGSRTSNPVTRISSSPAKMQQQQQQQHQSSLYDDDPLISSMMMSFQPSAAPPFPSSSFGSSTTPSLSLPIGPNPSSMSLLSANNPLSSSSSSTTNPSPLHHNTQQHQHQQLHSFSGKRTSNPPLTTATTTTSTPTTTNSNTSSNITPSTSSSSSSSPSVIVGGGNSMSSSSSSFSSSEKYGIMGMLQLISKPQQQQQQHHQLQEQQQGGGGGEGNIVSRGTDLTSLGLNLNSSDFVSPWYDGSTTKTSLNNFLYGKKEPEYYLPMCYYVPNVPSFPKMNLLSDESLFYIFYGFPKDILQSASAAELFKRDWRYHKELKIWLQRVPNVELLAKSNTSEKGSYFYFDINLWDKVKKDNFVINYDQLEMIPPPVPAFPASSSSSSSSSLSSVASISSSTTAAVPPASA